jgi:hypothetical protein
VAVVRTEDADVLRGTSGRKVGGVEGADLDGTAGGFFESARDGIAAEGPMSCEHDDAGDDQTEETET